MTLRLYVNGVQVGTRAVAGPLLTSTGCLRLGGNSIWGEFFAGRLDEIRLYNRALTQGEIQTDMNTAVGGSTTDTTPPLRSNGLPIGTLAIGTTQTAVSLTTDEAATCRYSTTAGVAYASMPNTFTTTGSTSHSRTVTGLTNGGSYTFYIRCVDGLANANLNDFTVAFSVAATRQRPGRRIRFQRRGRHERGAMSRAPGTSARFRRELDERRPLRQSPELRRGQRLGHRRRARFLDLTTGMTLEAWVFPTANVSGSWRNVLIKERTAGEAYNLYANADTNGSRRCTSCGPARP